MSAIYWNNPFVSTKTARWSAFLSGSAAIGLAFVAQYGAWRKIKEQLEAEELRSIGSDIQGRIVFGYLETRNAHLFTNFELGIPGSDEIVWSDLPDHSCCVCFFIDAVNHNLTPARFRPEMTTVDVTIGGATFHGKWQHIIAGTIASDARRNDKRLHDAFDGWFARREALEQGVSWFGDMSFLVESFDRTVLNPSGSVRADVLITIHDTLGKIHQLRAQNLELLSGKLGTIGTEIPL